MNIIYTCTPHPGLRNVGDHAQAVCIHRWLKKHYPGIPVLEFHKKTPIQKIKQAVGPDDLIFIHSGGNMNNVAKISENCRRAVIKAFPDNRIVSLPQTISFGPTAWPEAEAVYNAHDQLTVLARDPVSYNEAAAHLGTCQVGLCPDFVLGYHWDLPLKSRCDVLFCLRHDWESLNRPSKNVEQPPPAVSRKTGDGFQCRSNTGEGACATGQDHFQEAVKPPDRDDLIRVCEGMTFDYLDTSTPEDIGVNDREYELRRVLSIFGDHRFIITDRFHGIIFAVLARRPCVVLETKTHKLSGSYWWFRHNPQVVFAGGRNLETAIQEALSAPPARPVDWNACWFDQLPAFLDGKPSPFDLCACIRQRRSRRRWLDLPIADMILRDLMYAGTDAPSGSNAQCVRFRVVTDPVAIAQICRARRHNGFIENHPPAIILCGYDYNVPGTILYQARARRWLPLAYQDVAAAMQNMCLMAENFGLAACWVSAFDADKGHEPGPDKGHEPGLDKGLQPLAPKGRMNQAINAAIGFNRPNFEWISALFVGIGDKPWLLDETHQGRPIERAPLEDYLV